MAIRLYSAYLKTDNIPPRRGPETGDGACVCYNDWKKEINEKIELPRKYFHFPDGY
jgi:hypothetical protein